MEAQASDRSYLYNNAGARMMGTGNIAVALDLFRGALESKLSYERTLHPVGGAGQLVLDPIYRCVTPDSVSTAESHLSSLEDPASASESAPGAPESSDQSDTSRLLLQPGPGTGANPPSVGPGGAAAYDDSVTVVPEESRGYSPFFYGHPFELANGPRTSTELTSATIVFNLGLVHHYQSRSSPRAAAFYEISAALLSSEPETADSILLKIALLNNFGIWCYENGDGETLRTCMEHLSAVVESTRFPVNVEVVNGVRRNVQWLLTPPNGGSPAA